MATRKTTTITSSGKALNPAIGTWLGAIAAIVGLYLTWKWLTAPRATSGLSGGFVGGGYGGGAASTGQDASTSTNSLLQKLANLLNNKKSGGSGISFGNGGGSRGSAGAQTSASLADQIAAISGFSTIANNMPLPQLGGQSLETYDPGAFDQSLIAGDAIAYKPLQNFDLSGMAFNPIDLGGENIPMLDYGSGLGDLSIPEEPLQNFDLSGMAFGPGGDVATVPGGINGGLSDNFGGSAGSKTFDFFPQLADISGGGDMSDSGTFFG